jgi:sec-independent protein translocase protein TatC
MDQTAAVEQTALEHLHELMYRLLWPVGFLICGGAVAYVFRLRIITFLQRPLHETLYYTSPMGSFQFVMQVCLLCGVLCALPVLLYNVLRFIEPAFTQKFSRRMVWGILGASLALTCAGAGFGYFVTLPVALRFFVTVGTAQLHPLISVNEYLSFILGYLMTFALVFQLPLLLLFINRIRPFGPGTLGKKRTIVYVGAFAISLIMPSSPDPLSQVSLAIPIISLYELSILLVRWQNRKRRKAAGQHEAESPVPAEEATELSAGLLPGYAPADVSQPASTLVQFSRPRSVDGIVRRPAVLPRADYRMGVRNGQSPNIGQPIPQYISDIL